MSVQEIPVRGAYRLRVRFEREEGERWEAAVYRPPTSAEAGDEAERRYGARSRTGRLPDEFWAWRWHTGGSEHLHFALAEAWGKAPYDPDVRRDALYVESRFLG